VNRAELTEAFRTLGARDPAAWASSQIEQDIPQLHRFAFLKQAWGAVVEPGNANWIENLQRSQGPSASALNRLVDAGCKVEDLTLIVRAMQTDILFSTCYLLDCPEPVEASDDAIGWGLFTCDAEGNPGEQIGALHESVLETDPCGEAGQL
jgi:hypothetical protein